MKEIEKAIEILDKLSFFGGQRAVPDGKERGMTIDETVEYLKAHGVKCKKVEDDRPDYRDFIAIFSYGDLGEGEVMKCIADNNLLCIQFEQAIHENERKNRKAGSNET